MAMTMVMPALAPRRDPEPLIHRHERHKADQDGEAQQQVPVWLHQHEAHMARLVLAQEDLRQQVEQGVAQQAADREGHHDRQRRRVDVRRAQREQEVRRPGDVQRCEQSVDGGRAGEERREETAHEGRGLR